MHDQLFVLDSLKKIAVVSSFLWLYYLIIYKLDGRKNQIRKRNMQDKSVKKKRSDMKQLGDEMKLSGTCTFSLKFQTVETQESLITHGIRANESFVSCEFWEFCEARKKNKKTRKINVYCYPVRIPRNLLLVINDTLLLSLNYC